MTLTELRYITAVSRFLHFGRAADACFVSQPTLSVAIRKLEEELGVTLFERGRNEVRITPVGERIVEQAQRVLEQAESIKQIATEGKDQLSSPLHLGVIYTIGPYLLPHLIPLLHQQAPEMPIVIREDFTTNLSEALKRGELDIIILSQPYAEHGVTVRDLYDEPFVMAMPSGHPLSKKRSIKPDDISNETLLLLGTGNCFRDQVLEFCPNCNATGGALDSKLQKSLEGSSLETIRHMAASGAGVTVLPCTSAGDRTDLDGLLTTRPFAKPTPYRTVSLAYRTSFPRLKSVETLQQAIADCPLNCISNK